MAFGALGGVQAVPGAVSSAAVTERVAFIRRTYAHLGGAVLAFVALEAMLITSDLGMRITQTLLSGSWLLVLGAFMVVGWVANRWAMSGGSVGKQYLGLGLYVLAETVIFCPLLFIAQYYSGENHVIAQAGVTTLLLFGGLSASVLLTKKDFSFMRGALSIGCFAGIAVILGGYLFGFTLGLWFSVGMLVLASGYVLYYTSNVLHHYRTDQHVAASLALFSALALMFWYVLQIAMSLSRD